MNKTLSPWFQVGFFTCLSLLTNNSVSAQSISSDGTLPTPTEVTPTATGVEIDGGTTRGGNLFHSFKDFSVPTGSEAAFKNAPDVVNILNRVTGGNISNIDGLLRANGSANLFLINPAGIVFGKGASLDIGGSFYGSTADSILFPDGVEFSATDTAAEPILTINAPIGLNFRDNPQPIVNRSQAPAPIEGYIKGFQVNGGKNLALIGGDVSIERALVGASGGRIELGGLSAAGTVKFNIDDGSFSFPEGVARSNVFLDNATAYVSGSSEGGGSLAVNAKNLELKQGSQIFAGIQSVGIGGDIGSTNAQAGDIFINATDNITLDDFSRISNNVSSGDIGKPGDINIVTNSLSLTNGSRVIASTFGNANSGIVRIKATDISADGVSQSGFLSGIFSTVEEGAVGNSGGIDLTTASLTLTNGAVISASTFGEGSSGKITIQASNNILSDGIGSTGFSSGIFSTVAEVAVGDSGGIDLTTASLTLTNGGQINASTFGEGNSGKITIQASNNVLSDGIGSTGFSSGIFSTVEEGAVGDSGGIDLTTASLTLTNGGQINASTFGEGNAGEVDITTKNLSVTNSGVINAETYGEGDANNLNIDTNKLFIGDGATVSTSTFGQGNAGNLTVNASESIELRGEARDRNGKTTSPGGLYADVSIGGQGKGGDLTINTKRLSVSDGSKVQASTFGEGDAGDLTIRASDIDVFETPLYNVYSTGIFAEVSQAINPDSPSTIIARGKGNAGNLTIETERLRIKDGGQVAVSTYGEGNAGNLFVKASDSIEVSGRIQNINELGISEGESFLAAEVQKGATGRGGNLKIETGKLTVANQGRISVASLDQSGTAGNLNIDANSIKLDRGIITSTTALGEGGKIIFNIDDTLTMRNNSSISAQALKNANGGNITINTPDGFIVAFPNQNNDIIASADRGEGGNIKIAAQSVFGIVERPLNPITNDINASSEFGLDGNIEINTPDVDPFQETAEAPENVVEQDEVVAGVCDGNQTAEDILAGRENTFVVNGKGGVPPEPTEPFAAETLIINGQSVIPNGEIEKKALEEQYPPIMTDQGPIYPARGIVKNPDGSIYLSAYPTNNIQRIPNNSSNCGAASLNSQ